MTGGARTGAFGKRGIARGGDSKPGRPVPLAAGALDGTAVPWEERTGNLLSSTQ